MEKWASLELQHVQLGDSRRKKRLVKIVEDLASQPGESVPQASGNVAATTAVYDFWNSRYFHPQDIRIAHRVSTIETIKQHNTVLAIQDTTDLDFTAHPATIGLGPTDHSSLVGLKVHSTFVTSTQGVPLGVIDQQVWAREKETIGIAKQRRQRETKDKESQRWLDAATVTQQVIPQDIQVVTITDREGDIYDLFAMPRTENSDFLIRATHNRRVDHETKYLHQAIHSMQPCGTITIELQRHPERETRKATLTLRFITLEIQVPLHHLKRSELKPIGLQVVLAEEENPPQGVTPISWLLLTTIEVAGFDDAVRCVRWYTYRWLIERYHYTLKSGCGIEKLQLETARRIEMALATYSIVAWRLLCLTYEARMNPNQSCEIVLQSDEWQSVCATIDRTPHPPQTPPSLREAVRMIATLGGFLGRIGDGEPGVKTIWRGMRRLHDIATTTEIASLQLSKFPLLLTFAQRAPSRDRLLSSSSSSSQQVSFCQVHLWLSISKTPSL